MDGTSLSGNWATDKVCPASDSSSCAADFRFVAIKSQSGLQSFEDGILGMWFGASADLDVSYMKWLQNKSVVT